ncbi:MAG: hypothetical protein QNJ53_02170 [Pleurocapsa sp. MO_192.B19]|nr:hypothetical protein [Pleurocapsa sp. MO_192.B19]
MEEKLEESKTSFSSTRAMYPKELADLTDVQWAEVAPDKVVIATKDRTWLSRPNFGKTRFAQPMKSTGSITTTKNLLDGAIAAAKCAAKSSVRPTVLTPISWIWQLAEAYHLSNPISKLMEEACIGFSTIGRWSLAEWAAHKANQEKGYDRLALLDIQSMGSDAQAVVEALVPLAAEALIDYLICCVRDWNPIDCVGYSYKVESLAMTVKEEYIDEVEILLPPDVNATRYLRAYSSVGANTKHLEETVEVVAGLAAKERIRVAVACYKTALLCFNPATEDWMSDKELQQILEPLKLENQVLNQ